MKHIKPHNIGSQNPRTHLTEDDIIAMRALYRPRFLPYGTRKLYIQQMMKRYNLTYGGVRSILYHENWKHVQ